MNLPITVDQTQLKDVLLNVGLVRPVFIWGAPGIGKSSIVEEFAAELGLPCVCLTGSQLAPEDLIGVPQILDGTSVFCPPRSLVRKEPFCLFLDELNACSLEVQKAFYSLILECRIGEYHLPEGLHRSGGGQPDAGRRDHAPIAIRASEPNVPCGAPAKRARLALVGSSARDSPGRLWLSLRPSRPSVEPAAQSRGALFHTAQLAHAERRAEQLRRRYHRAAAQRSCLCVLSNAHATQFLAYCKYVQSKYALSKILSGAQRWPGRTRGQGRSVLPCPEPARPAL